MRKKPSEKPEHFPPCAVFGCGEPGEFKAPKARDAVGQYQYLCLEHVRKFNLAWDYFNGWNREEIEAFMHSSVHGHRPTWAIHQHAPKSNGFSPESLEEALRRMLGEDASAKPKKPETKTQRKWREALAVLNLEPDAEPGMVKSQYKKLVKKYHPDVNKGDKESEEMFKRITAAYTLLSKEYESANET